MRWVLSTLLVVGLVGCDESEGTDAGSGMDAGEEVDGGAGDVDAGGGDVDAGGGGDDAGGGDVDAGGGDVDAGDVDAGPVTACESDADCASGAEWCEGGACVACDNSGALCDLACAHGWEMYTRNGCTPCDCAPTNECEVDRDCRGMGERGVCYPGEFCWCDARTPDCCMGNVCSPDGCEGPISTGCVTRGCPRGVECVVEGTCAPSECSCGASGSWLCTDDCGGGECASP